VWGYDCSAFGDSDILISVSNKYVIKCFFGDL